MSAQKWMVALLPLLWTGAAIAQGRADRLQAQAQKLASVEYQLSPRDQQALDHHLAAIEQILARFQSGATLTCLSNGSPGTYERFFVTDPSTGAKIEKATTLENCRQIVSVQNQGLICASNGSPGSYEKFGLYDLGRRQRKAGDTTLQSCLTIVSQSAANFTCQSNSQAGSYEKFHLYNRQLDKAIGGDTTLEQCLGSIPR